MTEPQTSPTWPVSLPCFVVGQKEGQLRQSCGLELLSLFCLNLAAQLYRKDDPLTLRLVAVCLHRVTASPQQPLRKDMGVIMRTDGQS